MQVFLGQLMLKLLVGIREAANNRMAVMPNTISTTLSPFEKREYLTSGVHSDHVEDESHRSLFESESHRSLHFTFGNLSQNTEIVICN